MSLPLDQSDQIKSEAISKKDFFEPIFMRTFYVGVLVPLFFVHLGSSNLLAPYLEQSQWLVSKLAGIWPALPPQYEMVLSIRGPGHAASFGFLCAALWTWPIICAAAFFRENATTEILPVSPKEIGQLIILFPVAFLPFVLEQTKSTNPLFAFRADTWGFFYLRQWFLFSILAIVLSILIYAIGRIFMNLFRR